MAVNPDITILLDIYSAMLTEKERACLEYYYNDDLSLKEIADNESQLRRLRREQGYGSGSERETISRQGVRDSIKRAESKLLEMEEKLGLAKRYEAMAAELEKINEKARRIRQLGNLVPAGGEVAALADEIIETASRLLDE